MSDDWQPGDLAMCLTDRFQHSYGILKGSVHTVEAIWIEPNGWEFAGEIGLRFVGIPMKSGYYGLRAIRFRKIRPHQPDAEDAETIRLLTGLPARVPA